jgi:lysostaphin
MGWVNQLMAGTIGAALLLSGTALPLAAIASDVVSVQTDVDIAVTPPQPQLGDTLSVQVRMPASSSPPTVTASGQTFPSFPLTALPSNGGEQMYRALVPTSPLNTAGSFEIAVAANGRQQQVVVPLGDRQFPTQSITISGSSLEATQKELDAVDAFKKLVTLQQFWKGPFIRPNAGYVSTVYGIRRYYNGVFAQDYYHRGVDYAAAIGSPVVAPAAGQVALVGHYEDGFVVHGNVVGIDHGQGVASIFMHLQQIDVTEGQMVQPGTPIGLVGTTGASTGPHLHWGLYVNGVSVDPVPWRFGGVE